MKMQDVITAPLAFYFLHHNYFIKVLLKLKVLVSLIPLSCHITEHKTKLD